MMTYTMNYQIDPEITAFLDKSTLAYPENVLELSMHEHRECYRVLCEISQRYLQSSGMRFQFDITIQKTTIPKH